MGQQRSKTMDIKNDEFQEDLYPSKEAGLNNGQEENEAAQEATPTAYDIKGLHDTLADYTDDDLKQISIVPAGMRLKQGAVYINLRDPQPQEFVARGDMEASDSSWYVAKSEVDYQLWNRLIGVDNPQRTGDADER